MIKPVMNFVGKNGYVRDAIKYTSDTIKYGSDAANRLKSMTKSDWSRLKMRRVQLESVKRNAPELFYPAVGLCSAIPGGFSLGLLFGVGKKFIGKLIK